MKKLLLLSVILVLMTGFASTMWAVPQTIMLNESFEGASFPPANWSNVPGYTPWETYSDMAYAHTGAHCMKSGYSPEGDWMVVTPRLRPEAGANALTFWYRDYLDNSSWDYTDEYTYVQVSTTGTAFGDFTTLWTGDWATFTMTYQQASIDLSAFNGMDIFVAFHSYHTSGNYRMIDDVTGINFTPITTPPLPTTLVTPAQDALGASLNSSLSWNAALGFADGYKVYFDTVNPPVTMVSDQTGTTWTPPALLTASTEYWWKIVPYNAFGDAAPCSIWHFTTDTGVGVNMSDGSYTLPAGGSLEFFASGGPGADYQDNEDYTFTFYPQAGHYIKANFSAFETESGCDYLDIYDGIDTNATMIGSYNGTDALLGDVVASGAMTFRFTSDSSVTYYGWVATVYDMGSGVPDVPAGIDTPVNGITVNSTIDLTIDPTVTITDPILLALPTFDPAGSTVMSFNGTGMGDLTVNIPAGTWFVGVYNGTWTWSVPNPFVGPGTYTFVGINYGAKADAIVLLTPVDPTLPVELSSFTAVLTAEYFVNLTWVTESETQVLGFNVYRSNDSDVANAVRVNASAIGATNTSEQHTYSVTDREVETDATYYYWLENVDMGGGNALHGPQMVTVTGNPVPVLPEFSMLNSLYPNPFRSGTTANISVSVKAGETGTVTVYNILGQTVKTFKVNAGSHILKWDGKNCGSGVYFYRLTTPSLSSTKKLVIIK